MVTYAPIEDFDNYAKASFIFIYQISIIDA
jgi:hypothetical protein